MSEQNWLIDLSEALKTIKRRFKDCGAEILPSVIEQPEEFFTPEPEILEEEGKIREASSLKVRLAENFPSPIFVRTVLKEESRNVFKYFIDGTVRTIKALEGIEGDFYFPIVVGQIGAASLGRDQGRAPQTETIETQLILLIPLSQLSDTLRNSIKKLSTPFKIVDPLYLEEANIYDQERDYFKLRQRASRRAKYLMSEIEQNILSNCVSKIAEDELIGVDGSLFDILKRRKIDRQNLKQVVGVSKSFSLRPLMEIERVLKRNDCIKRLLSLREGERTDAIELWIDEDWVVTWYLRIRPLNKVPSPLDGIVKIEVHLPDYPAGQNLEKASINWSEIWNIISLGVYKERFPIPFQESRWHSLLYPIYCCERILKSSFLSKEVLKGLCLTALK